MCVCMHVCTRACALQATENHFLIKQMMHRYRRETDIRTCEGKCAYIRVHVCLRETPTGHACFKGTATVHPPSEAQLGSRAIFSRLLDGVSIHIWLCNFHSEGVRSPCDYLTRLLTPLDTQIQFYFPTLCHLAKGHHFVCLFLFFSK